MPLWPHNHTHVQMEGRIKNARNSFTRDFWLGFVHFLKVYDEDMSEHMKHTTLSLHAIYLCNTRKSGQRLMRFDIIHHGVNGGDKLQLLPIGHIWLIHMGETKGTTTYLQLGTFGRSTKEFPKEVCEFLINRRTSKVLGCNTCTSGGSDMGCGVSRYNCNVAWEGSPRVQKA